MSSEKDEERTSVQMCWPLNNAWMSGLKLWLHFHPPAFSRTIPWFRSPRFHSIMHLTLTLLFFPCRHYDYYFLFSSLSLFFFPSSIFLSVCSLFPETTRNDCSNMRCEKIVCPLRRRVNEREARINARGSSQLLEISFERNLPGLG